MQKKQSQTTILSIETESNLSSNTSTSERQSLEEIVLSNKSASAEWKTIAPERTQSIEIHDVILYTSALVILCASKPFEYIETYSIVFVTSQFRTYERIGLLLVQYVDESFRHC